MATAADKNTRHVGTDEETLSFFIRWEAAAMLFTCAFELRHHVALSSSAVVNDTLLENVVPPTAYLFELTHNIRVVVMDGNTHKCALSFAEFLKIW